MKPRVFLGSSVEGLSIAYSIQNNLAHDADITVWSQGVFELSATTIESLFEILESVDFGIFVFTPDDLIKIRETSNLTVRDNVLFEFGLFLGKLGRQRVFFVIPSNHDLHLPTDLLGITPAKYESNREDNNLLAATGPASHQIRLMLKKHGALQQVEEIATTPEILQEDKIFGNWFDDYLAKRYDDAIAKLDMAISLQTEIEDIIRLKSTKAFCQIRIDEKNVKFLDELLNEYKDTKEAYFIVAQTLSWENYIDRAIQITEEGINKFGNSAEYIELLASCHLKNGDQDSAIKCFQNELTPYNPTTSIKFADIYIEDKNFTTAREIIHRAYINYPNNTDLWSKYASIATDLNLNNIALFFYDKLAGQEPDNASHRGYIGNICLQLDLYDVALSAYQKANELANESQGWILSNIGNALKNKGFYNESIKYLRMSIDKNNSSDYAHDRLSGALKLKEDEYKLFKKATKEGQISIKEFSSSLLVNTSNNTDISIVKDEVS